MLNKTRSSVNIKELCEEEEEEEEEGEEEDNDAFASVSVTLGRVPNVDVAVNVC